MSPKVNILLILIVVTLFNDSYQELGAQTYCIDFLYKDMPGINKMECDLVSACNDVLQKSGLLNIDGCLTCYLRETNGIFEYQTYRDVSSICMGSTKSCTTKYTGNMFTLFNEYVNLVNTQEKIIELTQATNLVLESILIEKDQAPSKSGITVTEVKHTKDFFTYNVSTTLDYPIKCYKALSTEEPEFIEGDLYIILKPKTSGKVFSEYFPTGEYDCNEYSLYLKCYSLPFQENVTQFTLYKFLTRKHIEGSKTCTYFLDGVKIGDEDPTDPTDPSDPIEDIKEELIIFNSKTEEEKIEDLNTTSKTLKEMNQSTPLEKSKELLIAQNKISNLICNSDTKICSEVKTEIQIESWKVIEEIVNKSNTFIQSIGNGSTDENELEKSSKTILKTIIYSFNNKDSFPSTLNERALNTVSKILKDSENITDTFKNKTIKNNIIINYLTKTASKTVEIAIKELNISKETSHFTKKSSIKEVYNGIKELTKVFIKQEITNITETSFSFELIKHASQRRILEENTAMSEFVTKTFLDEITVQVPQKYIFDKNSDANGELSIGILLLDPYPLLTPKGAKKFYEKGVSINLFKTSGGKTEFIEVKDLNKTYPVSISFRKNDDDKRFEQCYIVTNGKEDALSSKTSDNVLTAKSLSFGDFLSGEKGGLSQIAIILIVLTCLVIAGGILIAVWAVSCKTKELKEDQIELNSLSSFFKTL